MKDISKLLEAANSIINKQSKLILEQQNILERFRKIFIGYGLNNKLQEKQIIELQKECKRITEMYIDNDKGEGGKKV